MENAVSRAYTVQEIDALRRACECKYMWGSYAPTFSSGTSRCYREEEKAKVVEEQVRTHMLAGHTAEDLINSGL
jgi:hypothetical protein